MRSVKISSTTSTPTGTEQSRPGPGNVQPARRDPFPYVIGGVLGVLVFGLLGVAYLLSQNNGSTPLGSANATPQGTPLSPAAILTVAAQLTPEPTTLGGAAPRMQIEQFRALYDDPAKRPLIIDVRAKATYDAGHIKGAISFPEADVDARIKELPKDKLIVAYCQ